MKEVVFWGMVVNIKKEKPRKKGDKKPKPKEEYDLFIFDKPIKTNKK